jgi:hypothetical protein
MPVQVARQVSLLRFPSIACVCVLLEGEIEESEAQAGWMLDDDDVVQVSTLNGDIVQYDHSSFPCCHSSMLILTS